jgi:hypothetical protein
VAEQIVAKVNGDIITKGELERSRRVLKEQEADALQEHIDTMLLIQKGKVLNIDVDHDVTRELADIQATDAKISDSDRFRCVAGGARRDVP